MGLFDAVRKTFDRPSPTHRSSVDVEAQPVSARPAQPEPMRVPEIQSKELIPAYDEGEAPKLIDCREPFEWAQLRIPGSIHIPMNQIPQRLSELDRDEAWVVVCAHGNRSYAVAGYLIQNGLQASSLAGGVTDWWMHGGKTESDHGRSSRNGRA